MKIVQIAAIESTHIKLLKALNEESVKKGQKFIVFVPLEIKRKTSKARRYSSRH